MKISRLIAGGAGLALVAVSTLAVTTSASADDFYVQSLGVEGSSYPAGWFTGTLSIPGEAGTTTFGPSGLAITGKVQLLNGTVPIADLTDLVDGLYFYTENGDFYYQIPVFGNSTANTGFTTFRPLDPGNRDKTDTWVTSGPIASPTGVLPNAYDAGAQATLVDFEAALTAQIGHSYEILAYGALFDNGAVDTVIAAYAGADTSYFLPRPSVSVTPNPVTPAAFASAAQGITISGSGFVPGGLAVYVDSPEGVDSQYLGTAVAGSDGTFSTKFNWTETTPPVLGTYTVYVYDQTENDRDGMTTTFVVANALAATGVDATGAIGVAGALLLAGVALAFVTTRRKNAVQA